MRPVVLALNNIYLPGFKGGGPVRSLSAIATRLSDEFDVRIVALDRDKRDLRPYESVVPNTWQIVGGAPVRYVRAGWSSVGELARVLREAPYDILYVNSLFCRRFGIPPVVLLGLLLTRKVPLIIAARGQLSEGALALGAHRKRRFLSLAGRSGLYREALWHATAVEEAVEIRRWFGVEARVHLAPNLSAAQEPSDARRVPKRRGRIRLAFLSRIVRKKNLAFAVRALVGVPGEVTLDVWGPVEDAAYRAEVERMAQVLIPSIPLRFLGPVHPEQVCEILSGYDALLFPTMGENFGHVILEALLAGCPPIISERTPWNDLEARGCGWALPLEQPDRWSRVLRELVEYDHRSQAELSSRATAFARTHLARGENIEANRELFRRALAERNP